MTALDAKAVAFGSRVKWTLEQIEQTNPGRVRLDWLRFTVPLDAVVSVEPALVNVTALELLDQRGRDLVRKCHTTEVEVYTTAHVVSAAAARQMVDLLGCFEVGQTLRGMDFYTSRTDLVFAGETVGHVLAGGSANNRSGASQAGTVHVNLFGSAMLVVTPDKLVKVREYLASVGGRITRADLSLDVWTGGDVLAVQQAYLDGQFNVRGKRPGQRNLGSWALGHSRTFEVGSRETGKLLRYYEKGDQLFGHEAASEWTRCEVEFRDNHRVIDLDVLTRPADFFAGAYPFCADLLDQERIKAEAQTIVTVPELADKTAEAAVVRITKWLKTSAAPAVVAAFDMGGDLLAEIIDQERHRVPRRLKGIAPDALRSAFKKVAEAFAPPPAPSFFGA